MKTLFRFIFALLLIVNSNTILAQEWANFRSYKKATGNDLLLDGNWLKKDRKRQTDVWKKANIFNLNIDKGFLKYKKISEIRDFYIWFDTDTKRRGNEINSIGVASIVASQLSKLDNFFIRLLIVRNKEVVKFGNEGSKEVFKFAFPQIRKIYFSEVPIKGEKAKEWDKLYGKTEQCVILKTIYHNLSKKAIKKLDRMAKGKGIYSLGVKRELRFEGNILDCNSRYKHGANKILTYYLKIKNNRNNNN